MSPTPTNDELANYLMLARTRSRFQWQAEVSAPGSSGVNLVNPDERAAQLLDRLATESGVSHA
jgi:hypothetical protein